MSRRIAGQNRPVVSMTVDYADVLEQAVANERHRVLREVEMAANSISVTKQKDYAYGTAPVEADAYRRSLLAAIERLR